MKPKHILFTIALTTVVLLTQAQEKYQYMVIEFDRLLKNEIQISLDGKEYLEEKADYGTTENAKHNVTPLLRKVSEYQDKGWELMNMETFNACGSGVCNSYFAYMRKKKEEKK
jgi:hypothetical protein